LQEFDIHLWSRLLSRLSVLPVNWEEGKFTSFAGRKEGRKMF
jgi:hypothetical protein